MSATSPAGSSSFTQRGPSELATRKRSRSARIATAVLGSVAMLGVQALQITSANAQTATLCAGGNLVEAEAGVLSGGTVVQQNAAASGGFDVGSFAFPGTQSWTSPTVVPANTNGRTIYLTFHYYATTGATRHLTVNGGLNTITFPATSTYSNFTVALAPAGGPVSYALTVPAANSGGLAVDTVTSCPAEPSGSTTTLAASTTAAPTTAPGTSFSGCSSTTLPSGYGALLQPTWTNTGWAAVTTYPCGQYGFGARHAVASTGWGASGLTSGSQPAGTKTLRVDLRGANPVKVVVQLNGATIAQTTVTPSSSTFGTVTLPFVTATAGRITLFVQATVGGNTSFQAQNFALATGTPPPTTGSTSTTTLATTTSTLATTTPTTLPPTTTATTTTSTTLPTGSTCNFGSVPEINKLVGPPEWQHTFWSSTVTFPCGTVGQNAIHIVNSTAWGATGFSAANRPAGPRKARVFVRSAANIPIRFVAQLNGVTIAQTTVQTNVGPAGSFTQADLSFTQLSAGRVTYFVQAASSSPATFEALRFTEPEAAVTFQVGAAGNFQYRANITCSNGRNETTPLATVTIVTVTAPSGTTCTGVITEMWHSTGIKLVIAEAIDKTYETSQSPITAMLTATAQTTSITVRATTVTGSPLASNFEVGIACDALDGSGQERFTIPAGSSTITYQKGAFVNDTCRVFGFTGAVSVNSGAGSAATQFTAFANGVVNLVVVPPAG